MSHRAWKQQLRAVVTNLRPSLAKISKSFRAWLSWIEQKLEKILGFPCFLILVVALLILLLIYYLTTDGDIWKFELIVLEIFLTLSVSYMILQSDIKTIRDFYRPQMIYSTHRSPPDADLVDRLLVVSLFIAGSVSVVLLLHCVINCWSYGNIVNTNLFLKTLVSVIISLLFVTVFGKMTLEYTINKAENMYPDCLRGYGDPKNIEGYER